MQTQIEIDDVVMQAALRTSGFQTMAEAVEAGLKLLLRQQGYARILELGGKLSWEKNAEEMPEPQE